MYNAPLSVPPEVIYDGSARAAVRVLLLCEPVLALGAGRGEANDVLTPLRRRLSHTRARAKRGGIRNAARGTTSTNTIILGCLLGGRDL